MASQGTWEEEQLEGEGKEGQTAHLCGRQQAQMSAAADGSCSRALGYCWPARGNEREGEAGQAPEPQPPAAGSPSACVVCKPAPPSQVLSEAKSVEESWGADFSCRLKSASGAIVAQGLCCCISGYPPT